MYTNMGGQFLGTDQFLSPPAPDSAVPQTTEKVYVLCGCQQGPVDRR